jgi:hypothetical protein
VCFSLLINEGLRKKKRGKMGEKKEKKRKSETKEKGN